MCSSPQRSGSAVPRSRLALISCSTGRDMPCKHVQISKQRIFKKAWPHAKHHLPTLARHAPYRNPQRPRPSPSFERTPRLLHTGCAPRPQAHLRVLAERALDLLVEVRVAVVDEVNVRVLAVRAATAEAVLALVPAGPHVGGSGWVRVCAPHGVPRSGSVRRGSRP